jgi:hypothetical protein
MAFYVFDLDGTLANLDHRRHLIEGEAKDHRAFFAAVSDDAPIAKTIDLLRTLDAAGAYIEVWSGRSDECRQATRAWLTRHGVPPRTPLIMRNAGDKRPDELVKFEFLRGSNEPDIIFDDRTKVVEMWRRKGISCF